VKKSSELFVFPIGTTGVQWKRWPAGGGNLEVAGGTDGERRTKVTSPGGGRRDVGEYDLVWPCSIGLRSCALLCDPCLSLNIACSSLISSFLINVTIHE